MRGPRRLDGRCPQLHAFSETPLGGRASFAPSDWAKEVATLLDQLGFERLAVVGHSSGGMDSARARQARMRRRSPPTYAGGACLANALSHAGHLRTKRLKAQLSGYVRQPTETSWLVA